jgi:CheY-like chemotaxis protein
MNTMTHPTKRPILIVDDDAVLADLLAAVLGEKGYPVETCTASREAVRRVDELRPRAMLLDIMMPEVDGWAVLRAVRLTPAGQRLPVVLMSGAWRAHEKQRDIGTSLELNPTLVLPKPFELCDLDTVLRRLGVVAGETFS